MRRLFTGAAQLTEAPPFPGLRSWGIVEQDQLLARRAWGRAGCGRQRCWRYWEWVTFLGCSVRGSQAPCSPQIPVLGVGKAAGEQHRAPSPACVFPLGWGSSELCHPICTRCLISLAIPISSCLKADCDVRCHTKRAAESFFFHKESSCSLLMIYLACATTGIGSSCARCWWGRSSAPPNLTCPGPWCCWRQL